MVISDERNSAKEEVRNEYMTRQSTIANELARRVSSGVSRYQALIDLCRESMGSNLDGSTSSSASSSAQDGSPSVGTLRRNLSNLRSEMLVDMNASRAPISPLISPHQRRDIPVRLAALGNASSEIPSRAPISPLISPHQRRDIPVRLADLGNAVRNLGPSFSGLRSPDYRRDRQNDSSSWRSQSLSAVRMMTEAVQTRRRDEVERTRALNALPPMIDPDIPAHHYNPINFRASQLTLKQAIRVMSTFDFDRHYERIKNTLLMFSVKIYGLEDCPLEDLRLAVFLFIERYFRMRPAIELCVRHVQDEVEPNAVGVLLESAITTSDILEKRNVLDNTRYRVSRNHVCSWIIWNYDG